MSTHVVVSRGAASAARRRARTVAGRWTVRTMALVYMGLMVALPISVIIAKGFGGGITALHDAISDSAGAHAIKLTLILAALTALLNAFFGTLLAFILVRYRFWGRGVISAIVDLPFAIPTLVTGVMLLALYGPNAPVGRFLDGLGVQVAFAPLGVLLALLFVTLPFVVRTVQPVLSELDIAEEEAAYSLGAGSWTTLRKVVLPALRPAIFGGTLLAFARALGEFGAVVIIAGNIAGETLTAPVYIFQLVTQFEPEQAAAVAALLFSFSFVLVLLVEKVILRRNEA